MSPAQSPDGRGSREISWSGLIGFPDLQSGSRFQLLSLVEIKTLINGAHTCKKPTIRMFVQ
jgi:hypothetical protein